VRRSTTVLGSREPPNVELVVFNVLTAVERLFANSGVRQGVQPGEIGDIACSRPVGNGSALLRTQVCKLRRTSSR
jgi:hypothetical protein